MPRPTIMPTQLRTEALAILTRHGMTYDGETFKKEKGVSNTSFSWDRWYIHRFFSQPRRLSGCCGVIEMATCYPPVQSRFPGLTSEEWKTLFNYNVRSVLESNRRRMAIITLINSQKPMVPFVEYAGFTQVSTGFNPGTRRKVNVWALSI